MTNLVSILPYIQVALSILMIVSILIQKSEASVGGSFGGNDNFSAGFHTRRGFERKLLYFTIVLVILFVITSILSLLFR
jgi:protein translocase SecG subunit